MRALTKGMDNDHFHIMIIDSDGLPGYDRMEQLVERQLSYLGGNRKKNHTSGHLQPYYNNGKNRLKSYLIKVFQVQSDDEAAASFRLLGGGKVAFGTEYFAGPR